MKKKIFCRQLYATSCEAAFVGHDPEELLKRVWQHLTTDDGHRDIRHHFQEMSDHEISKWQEQFSHAWRNASDLDA